MQYPEPKLMTSTKKLLFFPSPYPDELLFSILSRYHQRSCNFQSSYSNTDFFDTEHPSLNLLLPFSLNKLHSKFPDGSLMNVKRMITDHTLFRFFSVFTTKSHQDRISAFMSGSTANAYPSFMFHRHRLRSYSMAPRNLNRRFMRFCQKCVGSDLNAFGETYWHRSHQIYGIDVCHEHAEWLVESDIEVKELNKDITYKLPNESVVSPSRQQDSRCQNLMQQLAISAHWLLNNDVADIDVETVKRRHHIILQKLGYSTGIRFGCQMELLNQIVEYFTKLGFDTSSMQRLKHGQAIWLEGLLGDGLPLSHPLDNLLLMNFMGVSAEEFILEDASRFQPFGSGPWPCLNPAASHFNQDVIRRCELVSMGSFSGIEGVFSCDCGFTYAKMWSHKAGSNPDRFVKVKSYGLLYENELFRLKNDHNMNFFEIGKLLNINKMTAREMYNKIIHSDKYAESE